MPVKTRTEAVLLREDSLGVATEKKTRKIQRNGRDDTYRVSLNRDWLEQLSLTEQGSQTVHSLSLARAPVIVQHPAIIVQPVSVLSEAGEK